MADLSVNIAGVILKNPVISASGTYGFGCEYNELFPLERLGGISCKGTTLRERAGNAPPRIAETASGILNSVGLQNPGIDYFIKNSLPWLKKQNTVVIANIAGSTPEEYCKVAEKLNNTDVDMIELNISCPNVKEGGISFGVSCSAVEHITSLVRKACKKPLIVKLSPNVVDIGEIASAAEYAGADAVSMINTITGMKIDISTRKPILKNNIGGLSGPAILPIAVRMVWQTACRVNIPIIGMGGIASWQDAFEILLAGASAVQIGTANFTDAFTPIKVINGLNDYLDTNRLNGILDIIGKVEVWQ
jgi:dihydroorotate dehydrogenase (NAD+) catalytic subunit